MMLLQRSAWVSSFTRVKLLFHSTALLNLQALLLLKGSTMGMLCFRFSPPISRVVLCPTKLAAAAKLSMLPVKLLVECTLISSTVTPLGLILVVFETPALPCCCFLSPSSAACSSPPLSVAVPNGLSGGSSLPAVRIILPCIGSRGLVA